MAIAYVANSSGSGSSASATLALSASTVTAGNTIIVCTSNYTSGGRKTVASIADTASPSNTYSLVGSVGGGDSNHGMEIWVATNVTAKTGNVITITFNTSATYRVGASVEYSGLAASPYDTQSTFGIADGPTLTTASATNSQAAALCLAWYVAWDSPKPLTATSPVVLRVNTSDYAVAEKVVASTGSQSVSITAESAFPYVNVLTIFKAAAEAGSAGGIMLLMDHFNGGVAL